MTKSTKSSLSPATENVIKAIASYKPGYDRLTASVFSFSFGRAASSAGIRIAKQRGLIEVAYVSGAGTPVYRRTGAGV